MSAGKAYPATNFGTINVGWMRKSLQTASADQLVAVEDVKPLLLGLPPELGAPAQAPIVMVTWLVLHPILVIWIFSKSSLLTVQRA